MTQSFGLNANSALEALKSAVKSLKDDDLNEDLARDCAIKAWHLCDHVFLALDSNSQFKSLSDLKNHAKDNCTELAYLQDICIASKHGSITRYPPQIDKAIFQGGAFSNAFSRDFDISRLEVKLPDGKTMWYIDVVDCAVTFWSEFFEDNDLN